VICLARMYASMARGMLVALRYALHVHVPENPSERSWSSLPRHVPLLSLLRTSIAGRDLPCSWPYSRHTYALTVFVDMGEAIELLPNGPDLRSRYSCTLPYEMQVKSLNHDLIKTVTRRRTILLYPIKHLLALLLIVIHGHVLIIGDTRACRREGHGASLRNCLAGLSSTLYRVCSMSQVQSLIVLLALISFLARSSRASLLLPRWSQ
jgi:hypothetical protein